MDIMELFFFGHWFISGSNMLPGTDDFKMITDCFQQLLKIEMLAQSELNQTK